MAFFVFKTKYDDRYFFPFFLKKVQKIKSIKHVLNLQIASLLKQKLQLFYCLELNVACRKLKSLDGCYVLILSLNS